MTGSDVLADTASAVTKSVVNGIIDGDSVGEIAVNTSVNTIGAVLTSKVPKVVN